MKKLLSVFLFAVLLISTLPLLNVSAGGGEGTQENPYLIDSYDDFYNFGKAVKEDPNHGAGKYWRLTTDLILTDSNGNPAWIGAPIVGQYDLHDGGFAFEGNFDGDGHIIKNFTVNMDKYLYTGVETGNQNEGAYGLFSAIGGNAVIENLGVEDVTLRMGISNMWAAAGGIVGAMIDNATIRNCYSKSVGGQNGDTGQFSYNGGLVGAIEGNATIENCYSLSFSTPPSNYMYFGGIVGGIRSRTTSIRNCYSDTLIGVVASLDWSNSWQEIYYPTRTEWPWPGKYGSGRDNIWNWGFMGSDVAVEDIKAIPDALKDAFTADTENKNGGYPILNWQAPVANPYLIEAVDDLKGISKLLHTEGISFKLMDDIDLGGQDWMNYIIGTKARPFKGDFNGNGHVISNYRIDFNLPNDPEVSIGLFGYVGGDAHIYDLGVENAVIKRVSDWTYHQTAGGIAGELNGSASITQCYAKNISFKCPWENETNSYGQFYATGGLVGVVSGYGCEVISCYTTDIDIDTTDKSIKYPVMYDAGLVGMGEDFKRVENCYSTQPMMQSKMWLHVSNCYQGASHTEWYPNCSWDAKDADVTKLDFNWCNDFVPAAECGRKYPALKWEVNPNRYLNKVARGTMDNAKPSELFGTTSAFVTDGEAYASRSQVLVLPGNESVKYDVELEQGKYYRVSFRGYVATGEKTGLTFKLGNAILTEGMENPYLGGKDWDTKVAFIKAAETGIQTLEIGSGSQIVIDDIEIIEVDETLERKEVDYSLRLEYQLNDELNSDIFLRQNICDGLEVVYRSENGMLDENGCITDKVPVGLGAAKEKFYAKAVIADLEIEKSIDVNIKCKEPIDIVALILSDANRNRTFDLSKAEEVTAVQVKVNDDAADGKLFIALYKNDVLVGCKICEINADTVNVNMPVSGADRVKAFIMSDSTIEPFARSVANYDLFDTDSHVTIHTIGDSLCASYNYDPGTDFTDVSQNTLVGWGQIFDTKFQESNVTVDNSLAISGITAQRIISEGHFAKLLTKLKKNDYVFIQLSTNDCRYYSMEDFKRFLMQFITGIREKGAVPVFVTSPEALKAASDEPLEGGGYKTESTLKGFPDVEKEIAAEHDVALIDVNAAFLQLMQEHGLTGTKNLNYFVADELHFKYSGADFIATNVADGIKELGLPLAQFVK